jgi:TP901 family phage tail tape measure protein
VIPIPGGKIDILINPDFTGFEGNLKRGLDRAGGVAGTAARAIGLGITAGTAIAAVGLKKVVELGVEFQGNLNELQAVSGATAGQMAVVSKTAVALGNDMSLPATSAADAAQAMLELTKGGLSVSQAMTAAKGTLQLAAAASVDAGTAAELQSKALNEFGLSADQAGHVADVLANTANAAAGSITDIGYALNYAGPVAKSFGISIDDTAAALGVMANKGIQGEQAGTSLRGMLASLAAPSKQAAAALDTLGIKAFDAKGHFVGFDTIIGQLAKAHGKLSQAEFESAAATAFGNEGLTVANALAETGTKAFDDMRTAVSKQGGAADVAAAKMKGLGGALQGFQSQAETLGIDIYQKVSPGLESLVRSGTAALGQLDAVITSALDDAIAGATAFGPAIIAAIQAKADNIRDAGQKLLLPFVDGAQDTAARVVATVLHLSQDISRVASNAIDGLKPVTDAAGKLLTSLNQSGGPLSTAENGLEDLGSAAGTASTLLKPLGELVGLVVGALGNLPGPVQSAIVALVALKLAQKAVGDSSIPVISSIQQFRDEMRLAQGQLQITGGLAQNTGGTLRQFGHDLSDVGIDTYTTAQGLNRMGAAAAAFESSTVPAVVAARNFRDQTVAIRDGAAAAGQPISLMSAAIGTLVERSPALTAMRSAFQTASESVEHFGTAAGVAAAAGSGLKSIAGGLVSAMGGPLGIAIAAAGVGLSLLAQQQQNAAIAAQRHTTYVENLAQALRDSGGAIDANVRASQAKQIQDEKIGATDTKVVDSAKQFGISLKDITNATLDQGTALSNLREKIEAIIKAHTTLGHYDPYTQAHIPDSLDAQGRAAKDLLDAIIKLAGDLGDAKDSNKDLADAIDDGSTPAARGFASALRNIASSGGDTDIVLRNLKEAFDDLTGKQLSAQQAQADYNEVIDNAVKNFKGLADGSKQFHDSLLADGSVNIATENGRLLNTTLNQSADGFRKVAKSAFDASQAQGDNLVTSTKKAQDAAQTARDQFIDFATNALGLTADEASGLADKYGLIPKLVSTIIATPGMVDAQSDLAQLKLRFDEQPNAKTITVTTLSAEAEAALVTFGAHVTHLPDGHVTVEANTAIAQAAVDGFIRQNDGRRVTITVVGQSTQITVGGGRQAATNAAGNIIETYANGGLRPMRGGLAQIVAPNTWRVIGDRVRDDEAYIPINQSLRSQALLNETASRMGYALIKRYAAGGIASGTSQMPPATLAGAHITGQLTVNGLDGYIDGRIDAADAATGTAIAQRARY